MPYVGSYIWKIRQKIGHDPLLIPSSDTVAVDKDGKLLLIYNKDWNNWSFPGGYAEEHQTSDECAARELLEEGGIVADPKHLVPFAFVSGHSATYSSGDVTLPFTQVFLAKEWRDSGEGLDETEISHRQWFSVAELKEMTLSRNTEAIIKAYETFLQRHVYQMIDLKDA